MTFLPSFRLPRAGRDALCALWKAFDRAKMFGSKVDARLLFQDPFMKDNTRYRKYVPNCPMQHPSREMQFIRV